MEGVMIGPGPMIMYHRCHFTRIYVFFSSSSWLSDVLANIENVIVMCGDACVRERVHGGCARVPMHVHAAVAK
eukprot:361723-Chlamydomonas_euryale.AAC.7